MQKVFLSYSRRPTDKRLAERVERELARSEFKVWRDEKSLSAGAPTADSIAKAIEEADFFLPMLSSASLVSKWFQHELELAIVCRNSGKDLIVAPLLVEPCNIPPALKSIQYLDLGTDPDAMIARIGEWLKSSEKRAPRPKFELCSLSAEELSAVVEALPLSSQALWEMLGVQLELDDWSGSSDDAAHGPKRLFDAAARTGKVGALLRMLQQFERARPKKIAGLRAKRAETMTRPSVTLSDFKTCWQRIDGFQKKSATLLGSNRPKIAARPLKAYEIAVVGAFSAGKSTLINAILGRAILPETNSACTPCPTFVHRSTGVEEYAIATNLSKTEVSSMMTRMLAKAGIENTELERLLGEGHWGAFANLASQSPKPGFGNERLSHRSTLEEFLLPTARALSQFASKLGVARRLALEEIQKLRAPGPSEGTEQLLLKRIDVYVNAPALPEGVCLIDTPGVTSQNPAHKEFAFGVVQGCHALLVVEPFNAPLGEGPDAVMDAFYSRAAGKATTGTVGSSGKVFVVLNKCDLAPYDRGGTSQAVQSTLDLVRQKYSGTWGVPRDRYFGVSGLVFLEELDPATEGPAKSAIDPLLLEFRRFKSHLNRYLVDALEKLAATNTVTAFDDALETKKLEHKARIASLKAHTSSRAQLIRQLNEQRERHTAATDEAQREFAVLPREATQMAISSVEVAVDSLQTIALTELDSHWRVSHKLGNRVFNHWFTAVFNDELPLRTRAMLHSWTATAFPAWVKDRVQEIVNSILRKVLDTEDGSEGRFSHPPPPQCDDRFFEHLPDTQSLRTEWEVICIQSPLKSKSAREVLEQRVKAFHRHVIEAMHEKAPGLAQALVEHYAERDVQRLTGRVRALETAIAGAKHDAERSAAELQTKLEQVEASLQSSEALHAQLREIKAGVEQF